MKWFRWYRGTVEDAKFRMTASTITCHGHVTPLSRHVTVCHAIAVWAALLEDAARGDHRGVYTKGTAYLSVVLDINEEDVHAIINSFEKQGMVSIEGDDIKINQWYRLQYDNDARDPTAAERKRREREKNMSRSCHGDVTVLSRSCHDQKTDTETETEKSKEVHTKEIPPGVREGGLGETRASLRSAEKRGSRLPEDWQLSDEWGEWAMAYCAKKGFPDAEAFVIEQGVMFANHWKAKTGKDAAKLNWKATWENWIRRGLPEHMLKVKRLQREESYALHRK